MTAAASSSEIARAAEALVGSDLDGRYRIDALLGSGGMGAVFRAHHRFMDQAVAVKVLRPHLARDPSAVKRFVREARGTLKIHSDHAVKVLDFAVTDGGLLYMVLELLEGRTVGAELTSDGALAPRRAVRIARQVCAALAAAHKVGLIHRDLKPDNVMLVRRGADPDHVKVLDFGLAKVMEGTGERALSMAALTQGGIVFGTPDYMAPEQALGQPLDGRCDLYALGATLYEMVTGEAPYPRDNPLEVLAAHVRDPVPSARARVSTVPVALDQLIARCLAKDPAARPPTADALAAELAALEAGLGGALAPSHAATQPVPALPAAAPPRGEDDDDDLRPPRSRAAPWTVAALVAVAAVGVVAVALGRSPRAPAGAGRVDAAPPPPADAATARAVAGDAGTDAAPPPVDAGLAHPPTADRAAAHVDAALAAHRAGNRLRQLAEADAALRLAPRNKTARYLVGDALLGAGDRAGCKYLRQSGLPAARARADAAGCP